MVGDSASLPRVRPPHKPGSRKRGPGPTPSSLPTLLATAACPHSGTLAPWPPPTPSQVCAPIRRHAFFFVKVSLIPNVLLKNSCDFLHFFKIKCLISYHILSQKNPRFPKVHLKGVKSLRTEAHLRSYRTRFSRPGGGVRFYSPMCIYMASHFPKGLLCRRPFVNGCQWFGPKGCY